MAHDSCQVKKSEAPRRRRSAIIPGSSIRILSFVNTLANSSGVNEPRRGRNAIGGFIIYYRTLAPQLPDSFREMEPLFLAVICGCNAGLFREALHEVYGVGGWDQPWQLFVSASLGRDAESLGHKNRRRPPRPRRAYGCGGWLRDQRGWQLHRSASGDETLKVWDTKSAELPSYVLHRFTAKGLRLLFLTKSTSSQLAMPDSIFSGWYG